MIAMHKITAPVKGFNGAVGGVQFADGQAETDDPNLINYFRRHGYEVEGEFESSEKPLDKMKVDELKAYAAEHGIELGDVTKKDDIRAVIEATEDGRSDSEREADEQAAAFKSSDVG